MLEKQKYSELDIREICCKNALEINKLIAIKNKTLFVFNRGLKQLNCNNQGVMFKSI